MFAVILAVNQIYYLNKEENLMIRYLPIGIMAGLIIHVADKTFGMGV